MRTFAFLTLLFAVVGAVAACQSPSVKSGELGASTIEVTRSIEVGPPSPTPIICTPLPNDLSLHAEPKSETEVSIELSGLKPGESPAFIFTAELPGERRSEIESYPVARVDENGVFEFTQTELMPLDETKPNTWEVKVIHERGVACTEITLP